MKICIPIQVKPEGGGNYFLLNFINHLNSKGISHTDQLTDRYDVLFTSHWQVGYAEILRGIRRNPFLRLVHRIDGAAQDYGRRDNADEIQHQVNLLTDLTIFQSYYCRHSTREKFPVIVHDGPVIYNPVDTDRFRPDGEQIHFPERVKVCCVTWSTNPRKGAQSIYLVARANPDVGFVLCGHYSDAPQLPNIHVMGVLRREELATALRSCDVLLTFSENEACPNHVLEGLASGLPILYKESGATPEVVGDCGLPTEAENFCQQLSQVMERRQELSHKARDRALRHFHPDIIFPRYLEEIKRALDRPTTENVARRYVRAISYQRSVWPLLRRRLAFRRTKPMP